ncbi:AbrB/MazE/SpoVT family DNA-binding domain-containing protein [Nodosilinea sp. P-1105]|nr:AbrB/MazE/SpoVT family DNA-binding domain-containing protein [Nodosilinea sp. P-1105]
MCLNSFCGQKKSGNSQAVRIPKELQFGRLDVEYEIERQGDSLIIRPVGDSLEHALDRCHAGRTVRTAAS